MFSAQNIHIFVNNPHFEVCGCEDAQKEKGLSLFGCENDRTFATDSTDKIIKLTSTWNT